VLSCEQEARTARQVLSCEQEGACLGSRSDPARQVHAWDQEGTDLLEAWVLTQSPLRSRQGPSAGAIKFSIWSTSSFLENLIALFWCVLDGVTATVSGVQGIKTFGVESGDKICNGEKAFGSSDNDGWVCDFWRGVRGGFVRRLSGCVAGDCEGVAF
jgi:hypothetical protein